MQKQAPPEKMTFEQFHDWLDEDTHAEWVNGRVEILPPVSCIHQEVGLFLLSAFFTFAHSTSAGEVVFAPFQMRLANSNRSPDILYVSNANLHRLKSTYLDGAADLVVEVISPESRARDRGEKFYEYESAGVQEYWLIDPERRRAEFYQLAEDGAYRAMLMASEGAYHSRVLEGLWLRVEWLWQQPKPTIVELLRLWGLLA